MKEKAKFFKNADVEIWAKFKEKPNSDKYCATFCGYTRLLTTQLMVIKNNDREIP